MQFMEEQQLTVLLVGQDDASAETKSHIRRVLGQTLGVAEVTIDRMLTKKRAVICRSSDRETVERVQQALAGTGAVVEIVEELPLPTPVEQEDGWFSPSLSDVKRFVDSYINGLHSVMKSISVEEIKNLVDALLEARAADKQIFIIGNGGSASLASHLATDLIKERFPDPRYLFRVMSLTDNTSVITATANDFGYEYSFVNQLKPWLREDDVVIAISSSGNSPNILKALELAREVGAKTFGLFGFDGGKGAALADNLVHVPCKKGQYGFAEDATSVLVHLITVMIYEHDKENFESTQRQLERVTGPM